MLVIDKQGTDSSRSTSTAPADGMPVVDAEGDRISNMNAAAGSWRGRVTAGMDGIPVPVHLGEKDVGAGCVRGRRHIDRRTGHESEQRCRRGPSGRG